MENINSPYSMGANVNAPYMGANINAPYMGANVPHMMPTAPMYKCPPRRDNFILIIVLFILLIIVGCSIPKW